MSKQYFAFLLEKYVQGTLNAQQRSELAELLNAGEFEADLQALIDEKLNDPDCVDLPQAEVSGVIFQRIIQAKKNEAGEMTGRLYDIGIHRKWFSKFHLAAAVIILLVISCAVFWAISRYSSLKQEISQTKANIKNDVASPASAKAVITLANGKQIILDSATDGTLANLDHVKLNRLKDGQLVYSPVSPTANNLTEFNTISVPRGSRIVVLTLSDGTKVWLNAASSMRYPTVFSGQERKVEVTGEAYFEVAKDRSKKFIVSTHNVLTEVFGTHFNINAHDDEAMERITLMEGSVRITAGSDSRLLLPGEQAACAATGKLAIEKADIDQVIAWTQGRFQFEGFDIREVMLEIARWYDLETVFEGKPVSQHFRGGISRNVDASRVLKMLEATDAVHFTIEGKKIIVSP